MNLLLDTHALLWFAGSPEKLSESARQALMSNDHRLWISVVSVWEIQIKQQLGKLTLGTSLETLINAQQQANGMSLLSVELPHIYTLDELEHHHRDPFDRLLIAQAKAEQYTLVTRDEHIHQYSNSIKVLW